MAAGKPPSGLWALGLGREPCNGTSVFSLPPLRSQREVTGKTPASEPKASLRAQQEEQQDLGKGDRAPASVSASSSDVPKKEVLGSEHMERERLKNSGIRGAPPFWRWADGCPSKGGFMVTHRVEWG